MPSPFCPQSFALLVCGFLGDLAEGQQHGQIWCENFPPWAACGRQGNGQSVGPSRLPFLVAVSLCCGAAASRPSTEDCSKKTCPQHSQHPLPIPFTRQSIQQQPKSQPTQPTVVGSEPVLNISRAEWKPFSVVGTFSPIRFFPSTFVPSRGVVSSASWRAAQSPTNRLVIVRRAAHCPPIAPARPAATEACSAHSAAAQGQE